jgi:EPS-associated MarR family transcriptional regulator
MCSMNEHHLKEDFFSILRVLSSGDDLSQRDLSGHIGVSLGKTNYLLKELTKKGLVKIRNFTSRGEKLSKVKYILTKDGLEAKVRLTYFFLKKKEEEFLTLKNEFEKANTEAVATESTQEVKQEEENISL